MAVWIALVVAGVLGAGLALKRASSRGSIDAGRVSDSWLREQRAEKQERYPS